MAPMNTAPAAASAQIHQAPFEAETREKTSLPASVKQRQLPKTSDSVFCQPSAVLT